MRVPTKPTRRLWPATVHTIPLYPAPIDSLLRAAILRIEADAKLVRALTADAHVAERSRPVLDEARRMKRRMR